MTNPSGPNESDEPVVDGQAGPEDEAPERRFTAPSGFDAGKTQIIHTTPATTSEPPTEIMSVSEAPAGAAAAGALTEPLAHTGAVAPQQIPGRVNPPPTGRRRSWGWVIAVVLVIAALAAVAILGTLLLTRDDPRAVSQQDMVSTPTTARFVHA